MCYYLARHLFPVHCSEGSAAAVLVLRVHFTTPGPFSLFHESRRLYGANVIVFSGITPLMMIRCEGELNDVVGISDVL